MTGDDDGFIGTYQGGYRDIPYPYMLHVLGIFTYMYHRFKPNVGKYSIHGAYGLYTINP